LSSGLKILEITNVMIQELQVKLTAMEPMLIEEETNARGDKEIIKREKELAQE
jgi:hypothetical protein